MESAVCQRIDQHQKWALQESGECWSNLVSHLSNHDHSSWPDVREQETIVRCAGRAAPGGAQLPLLKDSEQRWAENGTIKPVFQLPRVRRAALPLSAGAAGLLRSPPPPAAIGLVPHNHPNLKARLLPLACSIFPGYIPSHHKMHCLETAALSNGVPRIPQWDMSHAGI